MLPQQLTGIRMRAAALCPTAAAIAGVNSPSSESAMTIATGPIITSALRQQTLRGAVRPGLEHSGGGDAVRPDRGDVRLRESGLDRLHDLAAYAAALSVYYENFHESFTSCKSLPLRRYFCREA